MPKSHAKVIPTLLAMACHSMVYYTGMRKRKRKKVEKKFDWRRFAKTFAIKFAYKAMEMLILVAIGAEFGWKLVRY